MNRRQAVLSRRAVIGGALVALAVPEQAMARQHKRAQHDLLVVMLKGPITPVANGPDLGLFTVNLSDGSYSTTKIYPVIGLPGHPSQKVPIGDFYVQLAASPMLCAYNLPGGNIAMEFTASDVATVDDGHGGNFVEGTYELNILEATGQFHYLAGGHAQMVDKLHLLAPGNGSGGIDEYCFCFITSGKEHGKEHDD